MARLNRPSHIKSIPAPETINLAADPVESRTLHTHESGYFNKKRLRAENQHDPGWVESRDNIPRPTTALKEYLFVIISQRLVKRYGALSFIGFEAIGDCPECRILLPRQICDDVGGAIGSMNTDLDIVMGAPHRVEVTDIVSTVDGAQPQCVALLSLNYTGRIDPAKIILDKEEIRYKPCDIPITDETASLLSTPAQRALTVALKTLLSDSGYSVLAKAALQALSPPWSDDSEPEVELPVPVPVVETPKETKKVSSKKPPKTPAKKTAAKTAVKRKAASKKVPVA
jgi:hypothetical protein